MLANQPALGDGSIDVLTICGSLRKNSYNRIVMNALAGLAPGGVRELDPREVMEQLRLQRGAAL